MENIKKILAAVNDLARVLEQAEQGQLSDGAAFSQCLDQIDAILSVPDLPADFRGPLEQRRAQIAELQAAVLLS